jgi:hypothetical protein
MLQIIEPLMKIMHIGRFSKDIHNLLWEPSRSHEAVAASAKDKQRVWGILKGFGQEEEIFGLVF